MKNDHITLSQCSKADLVWVINRIKIRMGPSPVGYYIDQALNDLWYEKQKQRINEAEGVAARADAKRREYIDLLKPYEGKRIVDIPIDVIRRADALMKEARNLDEKWKKLMDF